MTSDNRSADRTELDSMTRDFLAKGGKIVQCPPGSSDTVVYKRTSFRRRGAPAANGKTDQPDSPAPAAEVAADSSGASGADTAPAPAPVVESAAQSAKD